MKISHNWLQQFINLDMDPEQISELLTDLGLEVEGTETYESVKGGLKGIIVGHVLECEQHPNADRLKITSVDIGQDKPLNIVCGAPNVAKGQRVAVATIGTTLYSKDGEAWTIKKGKIRGEESHGMLCAEDELGLGDNHDGILILDDNLKIGSLLSEHFEVENDIVFEIGLTPNRADAMSHYGVARDLKAGLTQSGINAELISPSVSSFHIDNRTLKIDVDIKDTNKAPRYCGITLSGIEVKDSPSWLKHKLKAIGLSPINNVVDATNYVLHSLGQPLHAFDADKISDKKVIVRQAKKDEKFITLDGLERTLHCEDLVICDANKPMCIAGVFGGLNSGVSQTTTNIFLESAYFDPVSIRKTAKRHGLNTDASFRFERGIDPNITKYALKYAALLINEIAGGKISSDLSDDFKTKIEDKLVFLSFEKINKLTGQIIPKETIKEILSALEIKVNNVTETGLGLTIPAYRNDVEREVDVIEEILRVYGYNNIEVHDKLKTSISFSQKLKPYEIENSVADQLVNLGFFEIMTNSLTSSRHNNLSTEFTEPETVQILNPLSSDLSIMRKTLLFSGLETIAHNINRQQDRLKLFEFGKTYHNIQNERIEKKHLSLFLTGQTHPTHWNVNGSATDFFFTKGVVSAVFEKLGFNRLKTSPSNRDFFSEGQSLNIGQACLVEFGLVNPKIASEFGINQEVFYADFNWDQILKHIKTDNIKFKNIPKFPEVTRDFALLLDESVTFESIYKISKQTDNKYLKDIRLFDVFKGKNIPDGKKSYAVSFTLQASSKTLTDKDIDKIMSKLQTRLEKEVGAELR